MPVTWQKFSSSSFVVKLFHGSWRETLTFLPLLSFTPLYSTHLSLSISLGYLCVEWNFTTTYHVHRHEFARVLVYVGIPEEFSNSNYERLFHSHASWARVEWIKRWKMTRECRCLECIHEQLSQRVCAPIIRFKWLKKVVFIKNLSNCSIISVNKYQKIIKKWHNSNSSKKVMKNR